MAKKKLNKCLVSGNVLIFFRLLGRDFFFNSIEKT